MSDRSLWRMWPWSNLVMFGLLTRLVIGFLMRHSKGQNNIDSDADLANMVDLALWVISALLGAALVIIMRDAFQ